MGGTNRKSKALYLGLLIFLSVQPVFGQIFSREQKLQVGDNPVIRIPLTDRVEDDKIAKSLAICPVFKYVSDSIEPFTMFGVDLKEDQPPLIIRRMPDMTGIRDTGYTYLYFSGANTQYNEGYLLTLIGNFRKSRRTIYFYVDRNNNLDFTDDGPPVELPYEDMSVVITLKNLQVQESEYHLRLTRVQDESYQYKTLLTEHFKKHSGSKKFTHINYCYREQRLNTISGNYKAGNDSFTVALKDFNVNGVFNESCTDKFYVGKYLDKIYTEELIDILPEIDRTTFEWNRKLYKIRSIESSGKYVEIQEVEGVPLKKNLEVGKKIPKFTYVNTERETIKINKFRRSHIYIFFYDMEHLSPEDTLYLGKLHREFADKLRVVTLNHGDHPNIVYSNQYYDHIHWPMGFSSYYIGRLFRLEELPRGFYVGKRLRLRNEQISPEDLFKLLSTKAR